MQDFPKIEWRLRTKKAAPIEACQLWALDRIAAFEKKNARRPYVVECDHVSRGQYWFRLLAVSNQGHTVLTVDYWRG